MSTHQLTPMTSPAQSRPTAATASSERDRILEEQLPTVGYIVHRIATRLPEHVDVEDLHSVGVLGLMDAVEKFDDTKNCGFKTYAEYRIKGAILDHLRALDWAPRSVRRMARDLENASLEIEREHGRKADEAEIAERMGLDLDAFHERVLAVQGSHPLHLEDLGPRSDDGSPVVGCDDWLQDPNSPDTFEETARAECREQLENAIAALPEQQSVVLSLYYFDDLKMREIGQVLGVTESRVCQVHARATKRLRKQLEPASFAE